MVPLTLTFDIPARILMGLADGSLIRNGGVIQDTSGRVVMWLRELGEAGVLTSTSPTMLPGIDPVTGVLNLAMQGVNAGISMRGFAAVTQQLNQIQGMLSVATAASMLSLGVSAIGFVVISKRLKELEKRLEKAQEYLEKIDKKIDLGFYANFRAALDLAMNAFTMSKGDNRRSSALGAINRFLEAEHIYTDLADKELTVNSQIGDEYLLTLCLAYIAEARCHLELEEFDTAARRFQEGKNQINARIEKYVDLLLTDNPLMYLHPKLKGKTDFSRLTRIYQWKDPSLTENSVFELMRDRMVPEYDMLWSSQIDQWIESLPASIIESENIKKGFWGIKDEGREEIIQKLPASLEEMETMVETSQRFTSYELEVKAISKLGISFHEWLQLRPSESQEGRNLMYIVPEEPMNLS
jgi:tetratricopeptide (TPR) repeat protein